MDVWIGKWHSPRLEMGLWRFSLADRLFVREEQGLVLITSANAYLWYDWYDWSVQVVSLGEKSYHSVCPQYFDGMFKYSAAVHVSFICAVVRSTLLLLHFQQILCAYAIWLICLCARSLLMTCFILGSSPCINRCVQYATINSYEFIIYTWVFSFSLSTS